MLHIQIWNRHNFFPKIIQSYGSKTPAVSYLNIYRDGRVVGLGPSSLAIQIEFASRQYISPHTTFGKGSFGHKVNTTPNSEFYTNQRKTVLNMVTIVITSSDGVWPSLYRFSWNLQLLSDVTWASSLQISAKTCNQLPKVRQKFTSARM